jgi:uncharacterized protein YecE (DUF72 family)
MTPKRAVKTGCCGFIVPQREYFRLFNLIEIQQTFYQLPRLQTADKWRQAAPQGFEFTLKAWQLITHEPTSPTYRRLGRKIGAEEMNRFGRFRPTEEVFEAWNQTFMFARKLGANVVVFQCPASFRPSEENVSNMHEFFTRVDRDGIGFAWEPRGKWPEELIIKLCQDLDLVHCVDPFKNEPSHGDFQYFRLHGITSYDYNYTDADLQRLRGWVERKPTYVLFNNNWMRDNALRFLKFDKTVP